MQHGPMFRYFPLCLIFRGQTVKKEKRNSCENDFNNSPPKKQYLFFLYKVKNRIHELIGKMAQSNSKTVFC